MTPVYLVVTAVIAILLLRASKAENLAALAAWQCPPRLSRWATTTATLLLFVNILDEFGLLLAEWELPTGPLGWLRSIEGIPGLAQLLYLANLALVAPAVWAVLVDHTPLAGNRQRQVFFEQSNVAHVLLFVGLSALLTAMQFFVWGEVPPAVAILMAVIFAGTLIYVTQSVSHLDRVTREDLLPLEMLHRWHVRLLLFGLLLLQTMITKAGLLLLLVARTRPLVLRGIRRVLPRLEVGASAASPLTVEKLASHLHGSDQLSILAFYWLFTAGFWGLFFWQSHASPFPPADSGYPKTMTVSTLYTIVIALYLAVLSRTRPSRSARLLAIVALGLTFHLLPVAALDWFSPSVTPQGLNPVSTGIELFRSPWPVALFGAILHLLAFLLFFSQERALTHAHTALVLQDERGYRGAYRWSLAEAALGQSAPFMLAMTLFLTVLAVEPPPNATAARFAQIREGLHTVGAIGLVIFAALGLLMDWQIYAKAGSEPDKLYDAIRHRRGEAALARFYELCPGARRVGRSRVERGWDRLWLVYGVPVITVLGGALWLWFTRRAG